MLRRGPSPCGNVYLCLVLILVRAVDRPSYRNYGMFSNIPLRDRANLINLYADFHLGYVHHISRRLHLPRRLVCSRPSSVLLLL